MTGAILAGGFGTRLREVLPDRAKPVAPVNGRPFLEFLLAQLRPVVSRIILCTGYRAADVRQEIGDEWDGIPVLYSWEREPLGTAGALREAWRNYGQGAAWMIANGDSYVEIDPGELIAEHRSAGLIATMAAVEVEDGRRYGSLDIAADGRLLSFREKSDEPGSRWINAGVYIFEPALFEGLDDRTPLALERDILPGCIARGVHIARRRARFIDIGTPESYARAQEFFRARRE